MNSEREGAAPFVLREYRTSDLFSLVALDADCFETGIAYTLPEMRRFLSRATREVVLAESEGSIAGFCVGHRSPRTTGRIITLDVREDRRRGGLGAALLSAVIERLAAAGARRTVLEVDVRNPGAIAFYERLGFRRSGTLPDYYGPGRTAYQMTRGG
ncbi:MAG: N-acetyltransferase [Acidobacteriota bacterium]